MEYTSISHTDADALDYLCYLAINGSNMLFFLSESVVHIKISLLEESTLKLEISFIMTSCDSSYIPILKGFHWVFQKRKAFIDHEEETRMDLHG